MASTVKSFSLSPPSFASNLERRAHFRHSVRCLSSKNSSTAALSLDSVKVNNGAVNGAVREEGVAATESNDGYVGEGKRREKREREVVKLEPLWDDGYGSVTVQDYLDYAGDVIKPDGGPVRWFTPISCGPHLGGSPVLFFLPGKWCVFV